MYELFPAKVKSGSYPVRSGFNDFSKKLEKYINTHNKGDNAHTPEIIRKAFELYIERSRRNNWQYMKLAGYFILKDGVSVLESMCEEIITNPELIDDRRESNESGTFISI